ncbi:uncharacterized protein LOC126784544 isoform X1 [Argentina anserina]|uniref:uncharacterized protein LOC126784544 isoform X1 n=1 Tax=Argentina anserina TaxID=57926 RepID=UPI0021767A18|nr:uncharacterized protein LOC126784544 isoform X1 [Potentilla anserina]XP_050365965.1 uncharacterized protein LOC126784544 isoform X1 [Potentilla anserina]XP_050365966.1 uncharacterized protein LOC126784544 isoform X1 [Potentilla anserina]
MDRKAMVVERVYRKNIRPQPPQAKKGEGGIVGDMVEVFDTKCWKVVKVAKNNRVNIRFLGSIQSKEFDECNLRIRQAWDQNKWSMTEKVQKKNKIRYRSSDSKGQLEASCEEPYSKESKISCKRRKSNIYVGGPSMVNRWLYIQVDKTSTNNSSTDQPDPKMKKVTSYGMHKSFESTKYTDDSYQCSVASCSFNKLSDSQNESSAELGEDVGDISEAESSFPSLSGKKLSAPLLEPDLLDADIHQLELQAYKSTLQVLYASGPLSWEQESLLTNLRLSLHITNEEHLQHLRHLLSS